MAEYDVLCQGGFEQFFGGLVLGSEDESGSDTETDSEEVLDVEENELSKKVKQKENKPIGLLTEDISDSSSDSESDNEDNLLTEDVSDSSSDSEDALLTEDVSDSESDAPHEKPREKPRKNEGCDDFIAEGADEDAKLELLAVGGGKKKSKSRKKKSKSPKRSKKKSQKKSKKKDIPCEEERKDEPSVLPENEVETLPEIEELDEQPKPTDDDTTVTSQVTITEAYDAITEDADNLLTADNADNLLTADNADNLLVEDVDELLTEDVPVEEEREDNLMVDSITGGFETALSAYISSTA